MAVTFLAALPLSGAASGSDWRIIMTEADGTVVLVDGRTIHRNGSTLIFWQKDNHPNGSMDGARVRLDCSSKVWQLLSQQNVNSSGRIVSSLTRPLRPRPIEPGSAMERLSAKLCGALVKNFKR